ncbi:hypothetical protein CHU98_g6699 [Xylaria longipes]|nr:hypothetical protein CHU98_g6699 [Xylaria longipes]
MWQRYADVLINGVTEVGTYFGAAYAMIPDEKGETMYSAEKLGILFFMAEETAVALDLEPREACVVDEERYTAAEIERIERCYYEEKLTIDYSLDGLFTLWKCIRTDVDMATFVKTISQLSEDKATVYREKYEIRPQDLAITWLETADAARKHILITEGYCEMGEIREAEVLPTPTGPYRRLAMASPSPLVGMPPPVTMAMALPSPLFLGPGNTTYIALNTP